MKYTLSTKIKRIIICCTAFILCTLVVLPANAADRHYYIRPFRNGDTVYYDNSLTHWGNVRIYLFNSSDQSHPFEWNSRPEMKSVGNDIWKFSIPSDIPEGYTTDIEGRGYDYVIFTDGYDEQGQQTINLGFVGSGYAYKVDTCNDKICSGFWYLYDTSAVVLKYIRRVKEGDVIYFDNSEMNWDPDSIRIYLFDRTDGHDTPRIPWDERPSMTPIGNNMYKYPVTNTPSLEDHPANHIVFTGTSNGGDVQTIDLGFIDTGYAYLPDSWQEVSWQDYRALGYWYVYDTEYVSQTINEASAYMRKLECLDPSDYVSVANAIQAVDRVLNYGKIPVETDDTRVPGAYWSQIDTERQNLITRLNAIKQIYGEEPTICTFTPSIVKTIVDPQEVYRFGDTVYFKIDVYNSSNSLYINATVKDYLSGVTFDPSDNYEILLNQTVRTRRIAPLETLSIYAHYNVTQDVTQQLINSAEITTATASDTSYYLNPTTTYVAEVPFDTESWGDVPVPTGVDTNKSTFVILCASGFILLCTNVYASHRRKMGK